ncbi:cytochrome-c peroxidase [Coraliomargarita akajimensis]|uniref:Cytochrome-c peroxidase n=1 Tax=Coraliomargarita akajimensis (strain DSM 45221 / IAM 15411 / JCM 23193 / KCTC 12865 / 04OKA010-24) TaxID=583355 RepID=D5ENZ9_CORAD|nr:cytochrome c peroxidase [Coraliomargarita akajimensis]ADE53658.1 Cytochrome-c peroxidase [Coraliomargarita akajimensis DSM 45221]
MKRCQVLPAWLLLSTALGQAPILPEDSYDYVSAQLPKHYTQNQFPRQFRFQRAAIEFDNMPEDNPTTNAGATLGRVLFYDTKLSANGNVSCASCHQQKYGFSDPNARSEGFDGGHTRRHSMGLTNARFFDSGKFFWDERAPSLEAQVLIPFQDPIEMGLSLNQLEVLVRSQDYYPDLFKEAFGDARISSERISRALAQFIRSLVSTTSRYDQARSKVANAVRDFPDFTRQENHGKRLFFLPRSVGNGDRVNCAGCHVTEAFVGPVPNRPEASTNSLNNGLDAASTDDLGVYEATGRRRDIGKFKTPSLRNIEVTAPYMHDGRFVDLEAVVEHYSTGIQKHPSLRPPLLGMNGEPVNFDFSQREKDALIAFLKTLTDDEFLSDPKFSNPFGDRMGLE